MVIAVLFLIKELEFVFLEGDIKREGQKDYILLVVSDEYIL